MAKKLVLIVLVLFFGFWLFTDPSGLAAVARDVGSWTWAMLTSAFTGLIAFFAEL
jgi:hypothetical protein